MMDQENKNISDREFGILRTFVQSSTEQEIINFMSNK